MIFGFSTIFLFSNIRVYFAWLHPTFNYNCSTLSFFVNCYFPSFLHIFQSWYHVAKKTLKPTITHPLHWVWKRLGILALHILIKIHALFPCFFHFPWRFVHWFSSSINIVLVFFSWLVCGGMMFSFVLNVVLVFFVFSNN
jgi:hypothetical protein